MAHRPHTTKANQNTTTFVIQLVTAPGPSFRNPDGQKPVLNKKWIALLIYECWYYYNISLSLTRIILIIICEWDTHVKFLLPLPCVSYSTIQTQMSSSLEFDTCEALLPILICKHIYRGFSSTIRHIWENSSCDLSLHSVQYFNWSFW